MSPFATKTAVSHPIFVAMPSQEDSDMAQDTINVAVDLTNSDSSQLSNLWRATETRLRDAPDASDASFSPDAPDAPDSPGSDDVVVLDSQPPAASRSANPIPTGSRRRGGRRPSSTPHQSRSQGQSNKRWTNERNDQVMIWFQDCQALGLLNSSKKKDYGPAWEYVLENCQAA